MRQNHGELISNYSSQLKPLVHKVIKRESHRPWIFMDFRIMKPKGIVCDLTDSLESYVSVSMCAIELPNPFGPYQTFSLGWSWSSILHHL